MSKPATAEEIRTLCQMARLPDQSAELVAAGLTLLEVKCALFDLLILTWQAQQERTKAN